MTKKYEGSDQCFDWMYEKALTIGHYFVTSGVFTIFGTKTPVAGAPRM